MVAKENAAYSNIVWLSLMICCKQLFVCVIASVFGRVLRHNYLGLGGPLWFTSLSIRFFYLARLPDHPDLVLLSCNHCLLLHRSALRCSCSGIHQDGGGIPIAPISAVG